MPQTVLSKEDLWDLVVGGSAIATGGGGIGPTREQFDAYVDPILARGVTPKLLHPHEITNDTTVYMGIGVGGGVRRVDRERYLTPGMASSWRSDIDREQWARDQLRRMDNLYPLGSWADIDNGAMLKDKTAHRLAELCGAEADAYLPFEIGPNVFRQILAAADDNKPLVDADVAGYRAVPEISLSSLNIYEIPAYPLVFSSVWGDLIVLEQVVSWQRAEDIARHLAITSGGGTRGLMALDGLTVREKTFGGSVSKALEVGRAIRDALEHGRDVTEAAAAVANGHVLFRGEVLARVNEDHTAFIWGTEQITGTGQWTGQAFKIWYKNENHMTWIDDQPFVMSPDLVTVLDAKTGYGLSNFDAPAWDYGREVSVLGVPCAPLWHTDRGRRIFHPQRWGFACDYTPMEARLATIGSGT